MKYCARTYVDSIKWIRDELSSMDGLADSIMGLGDWDDAVCMGFDGKLLASADGPYNMRMVKLSALVHASTDVVVKGGRPIFALDCLIGSKRDLKQMVSSLRVQAEALEIPFLGGNTLVEESEPAASLAVFGKLLLDEPIRDCESLSGDVVALVGRPIWGSQEERLKLADNLFRTWYLALDEVSFNASKDVTKGGLEAVVYEMGEKSGKVFELRRSPYHMSRNLDNFLVTLSEAEYGKLSKVCAKTGCALERIGHVL